MPNILPRTHPDVKQIFNLEPNKYTFTIKRKDDKIQSTGVAYISLGKPKLPKDGGRLSLRLFWRAFATLRTKICPKAEIKERGDAYVDA